MKGEWQLLASIILNERIIILRVRFGSGITTFIEFVFNSKSIHKRRNGLMFQFTSIVRKLFESNIFTLFRDSPFSRNFSACYVNLPLSNARSANTHPNTTRELSKWCVWLGRSTRTSLESISGDSTPLHYHLIAYPGGQTDSSRREKWGCNFVRRALSPKVWIIADKRRKRKNCIVIKGRKVLVL